MVPCESKIDTIVCSVCNVGPADLFFDKVFRKHALEFEGGEGGSSAESHACSFKESGLLDGFASGLDHGLHASAASSTKVRDHFKRNESVVYSVV